MSKMEKVTKERFKYYQKRVRYWINKFHLGGWEVALRLESAVEWSGRCSFDNTNRVACISLADELHEITDTYIDRIAFHECMELLLAPYYGIATSREYDEDRHITVAHQIIKTLENVFFESTE